MAGSSCRRATPPRALAKQPDFVIHTGDITHLARPDEFDTKQQILNGKMLSQ
jgi:Icc protein